jgi:hypothetical protein
LITLSKIHFGHRLVFFALLAVLLIASSSSRAQWTGPGWYVHLETWMGDDFLAGPFQTREQCETARQRFAHAEDLECIYQAEKPH